MSTAHNDPKTALSFALSRLAQAQGEKLDSIRLADALRRVDGAPPAVELGRVASTMGLSRPQWLQRPDIAHLPLLSFTEGIGFAVILEQRADGCWRAITADGEHWLPDADLAGKTCRLSMRSADVKFGVSALFGAGDAGHGKFVGHVYRTLKLYRRQLLEAALATCFMGMLALATSLFSMQVYDRVIPTRSQDTLFILGSGVLLMIIFELAMKFARSHLMDSVVVGLDHRLAREVFLRLLDLRVDQIPASVGSLAGQVRGYEQVRGFYTASTLFTLVDMPLGLMGAVLIAVIGHPLVAAVPLVFAVISFALGMSIRRKIMRRAMEGADLSSKKTGLLVEAIEGAETIKAGSGGWRFLSKWVDITSQTIQNDLKVRSASDSVGYLGGSVQQLAYAGLIIVGALEVMQGNMTTGALVACSILSGRVLTPIIALPGLLVQHAHARAALEGLERLFELKTDNDGIERPLTPSVLQGNYHLEHVKFKYADNPPSLVVPALNIAQGERIAVLGPIGAGKSTLLRLLSGMYSASEGRVLIDNLEMSHVHRQVVSQHVGYLQQEHRLFQGTLRENLLVGLPDPGDDAIMAAMRRTGMDRMVSSHPKGLDRAIAEGGKGLSGGQKQLLAFTRLVLTAPNVLLLDEPTASMDDEQERKCLSALAEEAQKGRTMVIVTHKASVLPLVTRIIVVVGNRIALDGPRDAVIQQMREPLRAVPNVAREPAPASVA